MIWQDLGFANGGFLRLLIKVFFRKHLPCLFILFWELAFRFKGRVKRAPAIQAGVAALWHAFYLEG